MRTFILISVAALGALVLWAAAGLATAPAARRWSESTTRAFGSGYRRATGRSRRSRWPPIWSAPSCTASMPGAPFGDGLLVGSATRRTRQPQCSSDPSFAGRAAGNQAAPQHI